VLIPDVGDVAAPNSFIAEQAVLAEGSYAENVLFRFTHDLIGLSDGNGALFLFGEVFYQLSAVFSVMPMFLLGAFAARKQWFAYPKAHSRLFKMGLPCALLIGLAAKFPNAYTEGANTQLQTLAIYIGAPALALFYAGLIAFIIEKSRKQLLAPLASVGRMAFTNYILQSVCFTLLFYGYGFGFFAELGIFYGALLSIVFFIAQVLASILWLRFFRIGPLEWIWRAGTYLRFPQFKR
jgi:uncharacterized protein